MCGFIGLVSGAPTVFRSRELEQASEQLAHRGPDDAGYFIWDELRKGRAGKHLHVDTPGQVAMLHRRLSIIDLSARAHQPMSSPDGRFHLVYNGEIYNYLELREKLLRLGATFRSESDTEVLLAALATWGIGALNRLQGMFSFVCLDVAKRELLLARDPFGIKPLYYCTRAHSLAFASEPRSLLKLDGTSRKVDPEVLHDYLLSGHVDHGPKSFFSAIKSIPAGSYAIVSIDYPNSIDPRAYWELPSQRMTVDDISLTEAAERLREELVKSIGMHLRSDVAVGGALSGGIDSSAIFGIMRHIAPELKLEAFTYAADRPELDEEKWAALMAQAVGASLNVVRTDPSELRNDLKQLVASQGEPFGSTSIWAQYRVFSYARRQGVTVMLDGQGADEMLAGYRGYLLSSVLSRVEHGQPIRALRAFTAAMRMAGPELVLLATGPMFKASRRIGHHVTPWRTAPRAVGWLDENWWRERRDLSLPRLIGRMTSRPPGRMTLSGQLRETFLITGLPALLRYEDRNSMAHSIESRVPFLMPNIVKLCFELPEEYLISDGAISKAALRGAMRPYVPVEIVDRRDKVGFATPEREWFTGPLRDWVCDVLSGDVARGIGALNVPEALAEWGRILAGQARYDWRVWRWLNLIVWADEYDVDFAA